MALRRVFAQDSDFKESMFARQIAVMKGQAWNVVETLKQNDHGPLELTRRQRVCVWDDLVDVPVAIPMRVPSTEMNRRKAHIDQQEEMDIGASYASAPAAARQVHIPQYDLLGSPTNELPNPNRFDLTREDSIGDMSTLPEESMGTPVSPGASYDSQSHSQSLGAGADYTTHKEARHSLSANTLPLRPTAKGKTRFSFEFPRRNVDVGGKAGGAGAGAGAGTGTGAGGSVRRQRSMSTRSGKYQPPMIYGGDDLEGDLGYAAANELEGHKRKVIVERLETVKSKKPVFTWC
jgi:hypothetical protein